MKKSEDFRKPNMIRFNADFEVNHKLFQWGQEWEYDTKYTGSYELPDCPDPCTKIGTIYRIVIDSVNYDIPEIYVVEGTALNSVNINQFNTTDTWGKKVTQDAIEHYDDSNDFVKAAKQYLGKSIGAKPRADQADYASEIKREA